MRQGRPIWDRLSQASCTYLCPFRLFLLTLQACYHCLRPLAPARQAAGGDEEEGDKRGEGEGQAASSAGRHKGGGVRFCSSQCRTSANREYWQASERRKRGQGER